MTPPLADPVRARASCIVIVAWRVPHPRVSVFREGGSGRPPLCVSMNKANLSVAGAARAGQGRAGLGAGWGPTDFQVTACLTPLFGARHTQTTCKTDHLGPQLLPSRMDPPRLAPRLGHAAGREAASGATYWTIKHLLGVLGGRKPSTAEAQGPQAHTSRHRQRRSIDGYAPRTCVHLCWSLGANSSVPTGQARTCTHARSTLADKCRTGRALRVARAPRSSGKTAA